MTSNIDNKTATEKVATEHQDRIETPIKPSEIVTDAVAKGQVTSGYETLSWWQTVRKFKLVSFICFMAAFSAATDGYQVAMSASIIANKGFVKEFATKINPDGKQYLASNIISSWGACMNVGQILGQTGVTFVNARFGRKIGMYWLWLFLFASVLAETLARNWSVWLVAKMLAGYGVGCLQATVLGYISEVAPVRIRGGLLMCYSFWWTLGSFLTHVVLQRMNKTHPYNWLTPIYTQWGQIGLMILIYVFLPESPAWLATVGQEEKAKKVLKWLHRGVEDYDVDHQYHLLELAIEHERSVATEQRKESWLAIFRGTDGRRTLTALWTITAQQFTGLALFSTFGTYFFQQAGLPDPFSIKAITTSLQIVTVIAAVFLVDRLGRRLMACIATTLMWLTCLVVGILGTFHETKTVTYIFVLFASLWNVGIAANGAAGWGFIGEISSQRLRPYTSGFAASANSLGGLIMSVLMPYMVNANEWNWGLKTGFFYAGVGAPFVAGMWFLIPEVAGRSAAELDELFERKIKPWRFHKTETATERLVKAEREQ
ncbi:general substrate transporter [Penicillium canescens]|uniref:General substrate transporter n=1 Tax=Penicillium canescens TaxID=5083 RepID=A0AAD6N3H8_PENCN|nr:general substrate transporter [Penicillium canescens]KAJ6027072.1 general substrate transporter [Penicillium canescens]KAJ6040356.1 general substrate transporter [Penicillium canescens]KAJ6067291.1 general substrate transporter [Penicillium canescens]KAJ6085549.1 general substrate transporter [Penicillium canescens]KAJ6162323.1 general substrate transporter [Penicillium canescens]